MDIKYGAKVQYAVTDTEPNLTLAQIKYIQQVTGKLLFYARAIDNTMLHTLNMITTMTITGTTATLDAANYLLNYAACNPNAEIRYSASNMILNIHSDAAYLVAPEAQSRAGGFHFLGTKNRAQFNGPLLVLARNDQKCHDVRCRIRNQRSLYECPRSNPNQTRPHQSRSPTTGDTHHLRQQHRSRYYQRHHETKTIEII